MDSVLIKIQATRIILGETSKNSAGIYDEFGIIESLSEKKWIQADYEQFGLPFGSILKLEILRRGF